MNVWKAICPCHGEVTIKQKSQPANCKVKVACGPRSIRNCGSELTRCQGGAESIPTPVVTQPDHQGRAQAHELTFEQFCAVATATALANHGRKWSVSIPGRYDCFSDATTAILALRDAHSVAVNNALYFNLPDSPNFGDKPAIPPFAVLAQYPEVVACFPELGLQVSPAGDRGSHQKVVGHQMSMSL
jgi:hypothetical protein